MHLYPRRHCVETRREVLDALGKFRGSERRSIHSSAGPRTLGVRGGGGEEPDLARPQPPNEAWAASPSSSTKSSSNSKRADCTWTGKRTRGCDTGPLSVPPPELRGSGTAERVEEQEGTVTQEGGRPPGPAGACRALHSGGQYVGMREQKREMEADMAHEEDTWDVDSPQKLSRFVNRLAPQANRAGVGRRQAA